jgi:hypothetical protein
VGVIITLKLTAATNTDVEVIVALI